MHISSEESQQRLLARTFDESVSVLRRLVTFAISPLGLHVLAPQKFEAQPGAITLKICLCWPSKVDLLRRPLDTVILSHTPPPVAIGHLFRPPVALYDPPDFPPHATFMSSCHPELAQVAFIPKTYSKL